MSAASQASGSSPLKRKLSNDSLPSSSPTRRRKVNTELPTSSPKVSCLDSIGDDLPPPPRPIDPKGRETSTTEHHDPGISEHLSERTDREKSCSQDWEGNFEDINDVSKMLDDIKANVEVRRSLQRGHAKVRRYAAEIVALTDGRLGLKDLQQQMEAMPTSEEIRDGLVIQRLEREIQGVQELIRVKQDQQDDATTHLNSEANALNRHIRAVYQLVEGLNIRRFLILRKFPGKFFDDFAECQDLDLQRQEIEEELKGLRQEVDARQDEIHGLVIQVIQARGSKLSAEAEEALFALEDELEELKAAPDLLDLEKSCDDQADQLDRVEKQLCSVENRLYDTVEEQLVMEGVLKPVVISNLDNVDDLDEAAEGCREPSSTPVSLTEAKPLDEVRLSRQLTRRLQNVLRQRYKASVRLVEECQAHLESLRLLSDLSTEERALAELADHAFFLAKAQRTKAVVEAEAASLEILSSAQDAGVSGVPARSVGFSDHASDGYDNVTIDAHVAQTDLNGVQQWVDTELSAKAEVDCRNLNGDTIEMEGPDKPEVEERPLLEPLDVGESFSTIATGKEKSRIDGWLAVQKPRMIREKDAFKRHGRRMSV